MSDLLTAIGAFLVMGGLCALLERLWPEDVAQPRWRADSRLDMIYFLIRVGLSGLLVALTALSSRSLPRQESSLVAGLPVWFQVVAFLLVSDLVAYWVHRLEHELPPLWPVHAVHHSATKVDWLVASRNHPLELVLQKVVSSVPLYLLGFAPEYFAVLVPAVATYSLLQHANLSWSYGPFRYVLASPAFHRWHHSSQTEALDKNYAPLFPFLDYLFGTAYFPPAVHPTRYGLNKEVLPATLYDHMLHPFRAWRRQLLRPRAADTPAERLKPADDLIAIAAERRTL